MMTTEGLATPNWRQLRRWLVVPLAGGALLAGAAVAADRANAASGDFQIDFAAAAPNSYDHSTGGGAFDNRTINVDVVEQLNGGDFACGDIVSFLPRVTVDGGAQVAPSQTITMDFSFDASTTGGNGEVGFSDIVNVAVNYGDVGGDGVGGADAGISDDGGSTATLTSETLPVGFVGELEGTVTLNDLEPSEAVVVRIDVLLSCGTGPANGVVQSAITGAMNTVPDDGSINVGNQTIPLMSPGDVEQPPDDLDPLTISKTTIDAGVDGKWKWKIGKWTTSKLEQHARGPRPYTFRVLVDSHRFKVTQAVVKSRIAIANPNGVGITGELTDVLPGATCVETSGAGTPVPVTVTVPANGELVVPTVCTFAGDPGASLTNTATFTPDTDELEAISDSATATIDRSPPPDSPGQTVELRDPMYFGGKKVLKTFDAVNGPVSGTVSYTVKLIPPVTPGKCWWHHNTAHLFDTETDKKVKSSNQVSVFICRPKDAPKGTIKLPAVDKNGIPIITPKPGRKVTPIAAPKGNGPKFIPRRYRTRLRTRVLAPRRVFRGDAFRVRVITRNATRKKAYGTIVRVKVPKGLMVATRTRGITTKGRYAYWKVPKIGPRKRVARTLRLVAVKPGNKRIVVTSKARNAKRSRAADRVRVLRPRRSA